MSSADCKIPVKIQIEPGRYRYGWVKTLTPDPKGNIQIKYSNGKLSSRSAEGVEEEPRGFNVRPEQPITRGPEM